MTQDLSPDQLCFEEVGSAVEAAEPTTGGGSDGRRLPRTKAGGAGTDRAAIAYRFATGALGNLLAAATSDGVCFVALGDDRDALLADLRARFAGAVLTEVEETVADSAIAGWLATALAAVEEPRGMVGVPLDAVGTPFQQEVWAALRAIPAGTTLTYGDLARRMGRPAAVRAIAAACGANPVAVLVPCHRVVGATGSLTGYRWGVERKRALLARESRPVPKAFSAQVLVEGSVYGFRATDARFCDDDHPIANRCHKQRDGGHDD